MSTTDTTADTTGTEPTSTDAGRVDATVANRVTLDDLARRGLTVGAVVLLSLALVRGIAGLLVPLGGVQPASWPAVLGTGVVVAVGATLAYGVLTRLLDSPDRAFVGLATVVLVVSMLPLVFVAPSIPGVTTTVIAVLAAMHVVAAVGSVVVLTGRWP
jgi:hypothetical protein